MEEKLYNLGNELIEILKQIYMDGMNEASKDKLEKFDIYTLIQQKKFNEHNLKLDERWLITSYFLLLGYVSLAIDNYGIDRELIIFDDVIQYVDIPAFNVYPLLCIKKLKKVVNELEEQDI